MEGTLLVSERRIEANRKNAQRSTGPRTPEGKAKSSLNALRHGVTGQVSIMTVEDRAAHDKFCQELIDRFQPESPVEVQFASLIAEDFWRLQRIRAVENDVLALGNFSEAAAIDVGHPEIHASLTRARTFLDHSREFERLTLYEQRINRSIEKNRRQLDELQAERKRHRAVFPDRVFPDRNEALEQTCPPQQLPGAHADNAETANKQRKRPEPRQPADPEAESTPNGFVFSTADSRVTPPARWLPARHGRDQYR